MATASRPGEPQGSGLACPVRLQPFARPARMLVLIDYYLPGCKAGGPIRALSHLVEALGGEIDFRIITRDRDLGDSAPYPGVLVDRWQRVGGAEVFYASPATLSLGGLHRLLAREPFDALYLNSFFSVLSVRALLLRRLGLISRRPVVLAPRGEFYAGALSVRRRRKRLYITALRLLRSCDAVVWQASSPLEVQDIERLWSGARREARVVLTPELTVPVRSEETLAQRRRKRAGELKVVFLGRISRVKNLLGALRALQGVQGRIEFAIHGPIEDPAYWQECRALLRSLPSSVHARYLGTAEHHAVEGILRRSDLFLLPTLGESFGHGIVEALAAGCPVLIGDQTPWQDLEARHAGWVIPPADLAGYTARLEKLVRMDPEEHASWARGAFAYAHRLAKDTTTLEQNRHLFRSVLDPEYGGAGAPPAMEL